LLDLTFKDYPALKVSLIGSIPSMTLAFSLSSSFRNVRYSTSSLTMRFQRKSLILLYSSTVRIPLQILHKLLNPGQGLQSTLRIIVQNNLPPTLQQKEGLTPTYPRGEGEDDS